MDPTLLIIIASFLAALFGVLFVVFATDFIRSKTPQEKSASDLTATAPLPSFDATRSAYDVSPFWPRHLLDLFVRPGKFFTNELALGKRPSFLLVTWSYGITIVIDQVYRDLARERKNPANLGAMVAGSWFEFWFWVLIVGAVGGFVLWWLGGWWFSVRLRWSGAKDLNDTTAHLLYVYSSFVVSVPTIALALFWTATEPNYRQAFTVGKPYLLILLIFPFWSLVTSYIGARTLFDVAPWKARVWLVIVPAILYVFPFVLWAALLILFRLRS